MDKLTQKLIFVSSITSMYRDQIYYNLEKFSTKSHLNCLSLMICVVVVTIYKVKVGQFLLDF